MKTFAYPKIYRETAADNLGVMFDYGINSCHFDGDSLFDLFLKSGCANQFENGSPRVLVGMSGVELCRDVIFKSLRIHLDTEYPTSMYRSPEYWAGWILSQYQWYSCQSFQDIYSCVKIKDLINLYYPLHEAHEFKTFNILDKKLLSNKIHLYNVINENGEIVNLKPYPVETTSVHNYTPKQEER